MRAKTGEVPSCTARKYAAGLQTQGFLWSLCLPWPTILPSSCLGNHTGLSPRGSCQSTHLLVIFAGFPIELTQLPSPAVVADFANPWASSAEGIWSVYCSVPAEYLHPPSGNMDSWQDSFFPLIQEESRVINAHSLSTYV